MGLLLATSVNLMKVAGKPVVVLHKTAGRITLKNMVMCKTHDGKDAIKVTSADGFADGGYIQLSDLEATIQ